MRGRQNKLVGQVGEFLVCAELGKRGMIATPFSGNVPDFDVIATSADCRTVPIQVKTTTGNSFPARAEEWMNVEFSGTAQEVSPREIANPDLIYVLVAVGTISPDRFFIATKAELQLRIYQTYSTWLAAKKGIRPRNAQSTDCRFGIERIADFENRWSLIAERLSCKN